MRKERKNEALLWFGKWTSKLGNIVFDYANSVSIVGAFSHAPWVLALYQSSETVIQIVFNLIGGAKADSGSRKKILIVTDVLSAAICLAVSFFVASPRMAEVVIAANALLAVVYAFNSPTYRSIVREMVDGERIGMYNSVSNGGGEVIKIAGPMAGMLLVRWIGVRGALLFDALTFLLSAVSEMLLMPISGVQKKPKEKKNIFRDSWVYVRQYCAEIDEAARNRMKLIVRSLAEQNGVTEQLKAENQMEWVRQMNALSLIHI